MCDNQRKLNGHRNIDLDLGLALWTVIRYDKSMAGAEIVFRDNSWDGSDMGPHDMAVDMHAGGRGIKGEKSAFVTVLERFAPEDVQRALKPLSDYVDMHDSGAPVLDQLSPHLSKHQKQMFYFASIHMVLLAARSYFNNDDKAIFDYMCVYFDGMLNVAESMVRNELNFEQQTEILHNGKIGINHSGRRGMGHLLFERGVQVVIYIDGRNMGIRRQDGVSLRMDHPDILKVITDAGDKVGEGQNKWYCHPSGYLVAHGTKTSHSSEYPRTSPYDLAKVIAGLL